MGASPVGSHCASPSTWSGVPGRTGAGWVDLITNAGMLRPGDGRPSSEVGSSELAVDGADRGPDESMLSAVLMELEAPSDADRRCSRAGPGTGTGMRVGTARDPLASVGPGTISTGVCISPCHAHDGEQRSSIHDLAPIAHRLQVPLSRLHSPRPRQLAVVRKSVRHGRLSRPRFRTSSTSSSAPTSVPLPVRLCTLRSTRTPTTSQPWLSPPPCPPSRRRRSKRSPSPSPRRPTGTATR